MQVFIFAVAIAAVLGADPRCLVQNEKGYAVHIPHSTDCRKFYKCDEDHELSEELCPANLEYNPVLQVCDYPRGFCGYNFRTSIQSVLNCSVLPHGAFLPDYSDGCKSFFYCVNGIAKISHCRNGTKFDQDRGYCADESQVQCDSSKVLEFRTNKLNNEDNQLTILSRSADTNSEESHKYPNFKNGCKSYLECNEGDCVEVNCPENYIFDMIKETCVVRENAFCDNIDSHPAIESRGPEPSCVVEHGRWYADDDDCHMFYVCSGGKAYHQKCHTGQYFDRTKRACLKGDCPYIPGPGPNECDSTKDLFLPDDKDCTKFYICINNKMVHQQCGDHQMYDKTAKYCRKDDKGECYTGGDPGTCDGHPSGSSLPDPNDCTKFFLCIDGKKISQKCSFGQRFDNVKGYCVKDTTGICIPNGPTTECDKSCDGDPEGTKKVDPYNCAGFKLCVNREWRIQSCPGGYYFNPHTLECVPDDGSCDKVKPTPEPTTPLPELPCDGKPHGTYEPILTDCTKFRLCISGSWRYLTCDPGYYFNKDELICKFDDGTCDTVLPLPSTTPCEPIKCKDGALKPHADCTKYRMCIGGEWLERECGKGQMFDPLLNHCVRDPFDGTCRPKPTDCGGHLDGSFKENKDDCTGFFVCVTGTWIPQTCKPNQYFDKHLKYCVKDPLDGTCRPAPTPDPTLCDDQPHGSFKEKPGDCTGFLVCVLGSWIPQTCDPDKYYDKDLKYCIPDPLDGTCRPPLKKDCNGHPHGSQKENDHDCTGFFICVLGDWMPQTCGKDKYYDKKLKYCVVDPLDGTCREAPKPKDCAGHPHGSFKENTRDCTGFFICVLGTWVEQSCGPNKYYNPALKYCIQDPHDGTCRPASTTECDKTCDGMPEGTKKIIADNCAGFSLCVGGSWRAQTCDRGYWFNPKKLLCELDLLNKCDQTLPTLPPTKPPLEKSCGTSPHGTFRPDYDDCTSFHLCLYGEWRHLTCDPGYYFNKKLLVCVLNNGECENALPLPTPTPCPSQKKCDGHSHGSFKPHETDCRKFYVCVENTWNPQTCTDGFYFDKVNLYCRKDEHNICPGTPENCGKYKEGEYVAHANCKKFYICIQGSLAEYNCGVNQYFDKDLKYCRLGSCPGEDCSGLPDGSTFAYENPAECEKFYVCYGGKKVLNQCGTGFYYNTKDKVCKPHDRESCHPPTPSVDCTGHPDGYTFAYEIPTECEKFYVCYGGKKVLNQCRTGFYYNSRDGACKPDDHESCHPPTPSVDCTGKDDGFTFAYEIPTECEKFYVCYGGKKVLNQCRPGSYYNSRDNYCKPHDHESCHPPTIPTDCLGSDDGSTLAYEIPTECEKFYVCYNKKKVLNQCRTGYYYSPTDGACIPHDRKSCKPHTPPVDCTGKDDGTSIGFEDLKECEKFYVCYGGKKVLNKCGTGYYYDRVNNACTSGPCIYSGERCIGKDDGTIFKDPTDCSGFIVCYDGKEKQQLCPSGKRFDITSGYCVVNTGTCVPGTPQSSSIFNCKGKPDGTVFKHPQCNKFYLCKNEKLVISKCAESYLFDAKLGRCRINDGSCRDAGIEKICVGKGSSLLKHNKCTKFFKCENDQAIEKTCPANNFFDSKKRVCRFNNGECKDGRSYRTSVSDLNECTGRPDGVTIPDSDDCSIYYMCIRGKLVRQFCGKDHRFDQKLGRCVQDSGSCLLFSKITTYINTTCVNQVDGTYLPDLDACNKFYLCLNNFSIPQDCPDSYMFDQTTFTCVPNDGRCPLATVMPMETSLNNVNCEGKHGIFVPDVTNCEQFYACLYGKPEAFRCSNGQYFDAIKGICRPNNGECVQKSLTTGDICEGLKDGSLVAHETDCTMFYICNNGQPKETICDQGYFFDSIAKECRLDNGTCSGTRSRSNGICFGKHGTLLGHPDCQKYYICLNGQALLSQCLKGYYFDTKTGTCKNDLYGLCEPKNITIYEQTKQVSCIGKAENRFYANIEDNCQTFYTCVKGVPKIESCPAGLLYNAILNTCDWPGFVKCANRKTRVEEKTCVGAIDGVRYPNIKTGCKSFIHCVNGIAQETYCSDGLLFNSKNNACDWPKSVTCIGYGYQENTFSAVKLYH